MGDEILRLKIGSGIWTVDNILRWRGSEQCGDVLQTNRKRGLLQGLQRKTKCPGSQGGKRIRSNMRRRSFKGDEASVVGGDKSIGFEEPHVLVCHLQPLLWRFRHRDKEGAMT